MRCCREQSGFVALEAALWCLITLPLALLGVSMYALTHDQNVVQLLPESLMRETSGRVMTWRSDGVQGFFHVDQSSLVGVIEGLRDRGFAALQQTSFKLKDISVRACYWVYDVDPGTGEVSGAPRESDCRDRGDLGAALSLDATRATRIQRGVAKPIVLGGEVVEFVSRVVLVGVAVGGRYEGLAEYLRSETVQHGAVWVPREDVVL